MVYFIYPLHNSKDQWRTLNIHVNVCTCVSLLDIAKPGFDLCTLGCQGQHLLKAHVIVGAKIWDPWFKYGDGHGFSLRMHS
jgi:hypothetical protein